MGTCILVLSDSPAVGAKELWAFACGLTDPLYSFPHPGTTFEMQTWQAELEYLLLPFPVQLPRAQGLRVGTGRERLSPRPAAGQRRWEPGGRCGAGGDGDLQRAEEAAIPADTNVGTEIVNCVWKHQEAWDEVLNSVSAELAQEAVGYMGHVQWHRVKCGR